MEQRLKGRDVLARNNALIKEDLSKVEDMKLAYNQLESEDAESLFLLCGLIGGTIPVETLFILGMGLGLFGEFKKTIQGSRNRFNTVLHKLRSARLLLDGGDDNDNVTIDDLYSKVVISTRFTSEVVFSTRFTGENSLMMNSNCGSCEECWAIYLPDVGIDRFAELNTCQFPKLKILMFSPKNWIWTDAHPRNVEHHLEPLDFTSMKELQVLHIRFMRIAKLPSSIGILDNLCSLYLECCNVKDLTILGRLKALQILSFAWSTISRLPKEIGKLDKLKLLNLRHCDKLEIIDPDVLKGLTDLEELLMKESFDQWMDKESCNAKLAELKSLKKLTTLEISIRDPTILLEDADLPLVNLIRFWINIGNTDAGGYEGLRTMKKHLNIQNCPSVKHIASSSKNAFTILESLCIHNLINLEKIYHGHITSQCFIKLKVVIVTDCDQLECLWCLSQMQILVELEEIEVRNCNSMQAIAIAIARKDIVSADNKVEPYYLRRLVLAELPNMTSFCRRAEMTSEGAPIQAGVVDGGGDEGTELDTTTSDLQNIDSDSFFDRKVCLPNLEDLEFDSVGSFKRIWHDELSGSSFCKLATITVENCSDLLHIFPSTIIGRLYNLKSVKVENCLSLKSLFDCGSVDSYVKQATALLPALKSIDVKSCHSLESLFNCGSLDSNVEHINVLLPALEEVRVDDTCEQNTNIAWTTLASRIPIFSTSPSTLTI